MNKFAWLMLTVISIVSLFTQPWLTAVFLSINLLTISLYYLDKRAAIKNSRRISEKTLQVCALLGGWPAALLGQFHFRHKTQKKSFIRLLWCCILVNVAIISAAGYVYFDLTTVQM
ncbi:DUF1294 domain-containing protein [Shewanella ulleungensis]|jgi:uncharacterized membrane protein YsdA (DUF1294 family)|uniref:Cyanate transport n=1 Tax=Shewanella ulleungensis TaxID=2282699 RepID=A0ABQ2QGL0_9GAMM|nr:DUF1294 domain-containing protein [Shewanella ulleungensis]MCL1149538.1 DUF1294 domain-containing protein [Shewanella ulleungensis]GGP79759.1 cyanate transport [Shewanella ulleungensis]